MHSSRILAVAGINPGLRPVRDLLHEHVECIHGGVNRYVGTSKVISALRRREHGIAGDLAQDARVVLVAQGTSGLPVLHHGSRRFVQVVEVVEERRVRVVVRERVRLGYEGGQLRCVNHLRRDHARIVRVGHAEFASRDRVLQAILAIDRETVKVTAPRCPQGASLVAR